MVYGTGCLPSKIDGTEHKFEKIKMEIPEEFSYVGVMPPILDQGTTSKCVCYSLTAYLDWRKNQFEGDNNGSQYDIDALYDIRSNRFGEGMSIKEALHYLRHEGLNGTKIDAYALVGSTIALKQALILNGPCAAGMPVFSNTQEFWKNGNKMHGGHCVLIVGYNKDGFIIRNSWGSRYANKGYITLPYDEFEKIFECWTVI